MHFGTQKHPQMFQSINFEMPFASLSKHWSLRTICMKINFVVRFILSQIKLVFYMKGFARRLVCTRSPLKNSLVLINAQFHPGKKLINPKNVFIFSLQDILRVTIGEILKKCCYILVSLRGLIELYPRTDWCITVSLPCGWWRGWNAFESLHYILTTSNSSFDLVSLSILISGNASSTNAGTADRYQRQIQPAWLVSLNWHYAECYQYLQPPNPPRKNNHKTGWFTLKSQRASLGYIYAFSKGWFSTEQK